IMHILCITPWFPSQRQDQFGNFILDSIESLIEIGHSVTVLVTEPWRPAFAKYFNKMWKKKRIDIAQLNVNFTIHSKKYISIPNNYFKYYSHISYKKFIVPAILDILKRNNIDLIHAHTELAAMAVADLPV